MAHVLHNTECPQSYSFLSNFITCILKDCVVESCQSVMYFFKGLYYGLWKTIWYLLPGNASYMVFILFCIISRETYLCGISTK